MFAAVCTDRENRDVENKVSFASENSIVWDIGQQSKIVWSLWTMEGPPSIDNPFIPKHSATAKHDRGFIIFFDCLSI